MPDDRGPNFAGSFTPGAPKAPQAPPVDKAFAPPQPGQFVKPEDLPQIIIPDAAPRCGNCPFRAKPPAGQGVPANQLQCRSESPKVFMLTGQNVAGHPQINFLATYPPTTADEVCGKHPLLAGRAAAQQELEHQKTLAGLLAKEVVPSS